MSPQEHRGIELLFAARHLFPYCSCATWTLLLLFPEGEEPQQSWMQRSSLVTMTHLVSQLPGRGGEVCRRVLAPWELDAGGEQGLDHGDMIPLWLHLVTTVLTNVW